MTRGAVRAVLASELVKIRTVRSTAWALLLTLGLSAGLGYPVGLSFRDHPGMLHGGGQAFDPLFATFYSLTIGQLALVVFGVLVVAGEYSTGTIRASLMATPRRGLFYGGKMLAATLVAFGVSAVTVLVTFFTAQAALGSHRTYLSAPGVPAVMAGSCLYLTLICVFAMGVAAMLRSPLGSLALLLPLLFLSSQGFGNIPGAKTVTQYLPEETGLVIMHLTGSPADPRFGRDYGPSAGLVILILWAAAALIGGYLLLRRRDA